MLLADERGRPRAHRARLHLPALVEQHCECLPRPAEASRGEKASPNPTPNANPNPNQVCVYRGVPGLVEAMWSLVPKTKDEVAAAELRLERPESNCRARATSGQDSV